MPPDEAGNAAQIAYWNDRAGETWTRLQDRLDRLFEPIAALALEAADVAPNERVIDVGSGCGATLLELARRVIGVDVSEPMTARARERIAAAGLTNARIIVGDASAQSLPAKSADLLFSRFGVMFFDDPAAAFAHLRQAIRPEGRLLCAAWRVFADNPWFRVPMEAARGLIPPQPPAEPHAPGPFAFADDAHTEGLLMKAGWREVRLDRRDVPMKVAAAGNLAEAAEFATTVGPLARILGEMDAAAREPVRAAVAKALQPYDTADGFMLNGSIWLISGKA